MKSKETYMIDKVLRWSTLLCIMAVMFACSSNPESVPDIAEERAATESESVAAESAESEKLDYEFEDKELSDQGLRAFEQMAVQKMEDFADYVSLVASHELEHEFREQAGDMLLDVFTDQNAHMSFTSNNNDSGSVQMNEFVENIQNSQASKLTFKISDIVVTEALKISPDSTASGTITCTIEVHNSDTTSAPLMEGGDYLVEAEIVAHQVNKAFGDSSKKVWEVRLGNLRFRQN